MKKIIAIILLVSAILSLISCQKQSNNANKDTSNSNSAESTVELNTTDENIEEANVVPIETMTTFSYDDKTFTVPHNSIVSMNPEDNTFLSVMATGENTQYHNVLTPFGTKCGDSFEQICTAFSIKNSYALYGEIGETIKVYTGKEKIDFKSGGCMYFGYKVEKNGDCVAIDSTILEYLLAGTIQSNYSFSVILYSFKFDENEKTTNIFEVYCQNDALDKLLGK